MTFMALHYSHPELVSGASSYCLEMLKRVQHDADRCKEGVEL